MGFGSSKVCKSGSSIQKCRVMVRLIGKAIRFSEVVRVIEIFMETGRENIFG